MWWYDDWRPNRRLLSALHVDQRTQSFNCRLQLGSLGTCHLLRRQHRPCPSTLLHSRGVHTRQDMILTHRLTFRLWTPTLSLFSLA